MRRIPMIMAVVATTFFSCAKDDDQSLTKSICEQNNTGEVSVSNTQSDPYKVYVNGGYKQLVSSKSKTSFDLSPGTYTIKLEQSSGYVLYPTVYTKSVTINQCRTSYCSF